MQATPPSPSHPDTGEACRRQPALRRAWNSLRRSWYFHTRRPLKAVLEPGYTSTLPTQFTIETGNVCNLRCPGCPTGRREKNQPRGMLDFAGFRTVFDKVMPYAVEIHLFNWGEPFLNNDIVPMISLCSEHRIATHIDSNLAVRDFTTAEAEDVVRSGLSRLIGSIDGASQETYERYRVGGDFEMAVRNLEKLADARRRLSLETPHIAWKFLVNAWNEHEMESAKERAAAIGVPIYFDLMHVTEESWRSSLHRRAEAEELTQVQVKVKGEDTRVADHSRQHLEPSAPPTPARRERTRPVPIDELKVHPKLYSWCLQPFRMMFVDWNGNVYPCCNVYGDEYALGNLMTESLEEIWNNAGFRGCRRFLDNYGPPQETRSICETLPCPLEEKSVVVSP